MDGSVPGPRSAWPRSAGLGTVLRRHLCPGLVPSPRWPAGRTEPSRSPMQEVSRAMTDRHRALGGALDGGNQRVADPGAARRRGLGAGRDRLALRRPGRGRRGPLGLPRLPLLRAAARRPLDRGRLHPAPQPSPRGMDGPRPRGRQARPLREAAGADGRTRSTLIAEAAQRTGRHVLEAFMYRHAPRWRRAVSLVASGAIGRAAGGADRLRLLGPLDLANIRFIPEVGGGIIWDMGCYAANMARGVLGREPIEVFGFPDVREGQPAETTFTGVMRFGPHGQRALLGQLRLPQPLCPGGGGGERRLADAAGDGLPAGAVHQPAPPPGRRGDLRGRRRSPRSRRSPSWTPTGWRSSTWPTPSGAAPRSRTAWPTRGPTPRCCSPCTRRG